MSTVWDDMQSAEERIPRDRWQRPLIVPVNGGKAVPYTRVTTFASTVEDMFSLSQWQQRMVALGLAKRPDLLLSVSAHADDKDELNRIVDSAREAAAASAAATTGSALHKLTERYDYGQITLGDVPASNRADLAAYADATQPLTIHGIEQFVVIDDIKVAGTFDRIVEYGGQRYVADIKTGSIEYGTGKMAVQLSLYARGWLYEHGKPNRGGTGVSRNAGIIIHLPAGQGRCDLYWIDLRAGWEAAELCDKVRTWRKRKDLLAEASFAVAPAPATEADAAVAAVTETFPAAEVVSLDQLIAECQDTEDLEQLWSAHRDEWTADHTRLAAAHKLQLHQRALKDVATSAA